MEDLPKQMPFFPSIRSMYCYLSFVGGTREPVVESGRAQSMSSGSGLSYMGLARLLEGEEKFQGHIRIYPISRGE